MSVGPTIDAGTAVEYLVSDADHLRMAQERLVADWSPDSPPLTIVFSTLGRSVCRHASTSTEVELVEICSVIEALLARGDEMVKNAAATGMLEAMLAESSAGRFDMPVLASFLGPQTKAYCRSWDAFTGNETEGRSG